jgi:hypothetical protein
MKEDIRSLLYNVRRNVDNIGTDPYCDDYAQTQINDIETALDYIVELLAKIVEKIDVRN